MDPERWGRVCEVFGRVADAPGELRAELLRELSDGDEGLRHEVEALLAAEGQAGSFLAAPLAPPGGAAGTVEHAEPIPERIGPYRVLRQLGAGGMGTVYQAVRDDFPKTVAIKVVRAALDSEALRQSFRREREILATLEHPSIAHLHDGGATAEGRPYLVMEYVEGTTLLEHVASRRLAVAERLALFLEVCAAVAHAHAAGVLHRDIKPSNILVTREGRPKLLDFGVAKLLDVSGKGEPALTAAAVMTPEYASPEQVRGAPLGPASDVYSLGVMLYELLAGRRPYRFASRTPPEIERLVCETDPERPSVAAGRAMVERSTGDAGVARLPTDGSGQAAMADQVQRRLRGDLDAIILKALRKLPEDRYPSAAALADDLRRHLAGLPVLARRGSWRYRAWKLVRRHRAAAAAALLAATALGIGLAIPRRDHAAPAPGVQAAPALAPRPGVAVLGFTDLAPRPDSAWLGAAIGELLRANLAAGERLRTVAGETIAAARVELPNGAAGGFAAPTLARLRRDIGADLVVVGSYLVLGARDGAPRAPKDEEVRLTAMLQDTRSGQTLATVSVTAQESELDALVADAGGRLRAVLGLPELSEAASALAGLPRDPQAARWYSEGLAALRVLDARTARDRLQAAAQRQPDSALVHWALARAWSELGHEGRCESAARRAVELAGTLPRVQQVLVEAYYRQVSHDWPQATKLYQSLATLYPDDLEFGLLLATAQRRNNDPAASQVTVAQLRRLPAPSSDDPRIDLLESRAALRQTNGALCLAAARRASEKARRRGLPSLVVDGLELESAALAFQGDLAAAGVVAAEQLRVARQAGLRREEGEALESVGRNHWERGEPAPAQRLALQAREVYVGLGNATGIARISEMLASLQSALGDPRGALPLYDAAIAASHEAGDPSSEARAVFNSGQVHLALGDLEEAERRFATYVSLEALTEDPPRHVHASEALGALALARGQLDEAGAYSARCVAAAREMGSPDLGRRCELRSANLLAARGDLATARKALEQLLDEALRGSGEVSIPSIQHSLAGVLLAAGEASAAEAPARAAANTLAQQQDRDLASLARSRLALILLAGGKPDEALEVARTALVQTAETDDVEARLQATLGVARVLAERGTASERRRAPQLARQALAEAERHGLVVTAVDARLTLGEILLTTPAGHGGQGRAEVLGAARRAQALGLVLLARRAEAVIARHGDLDARLVEPDKG